jgi:TatD DNase family protein
MILIDSHCHLEYPEIMNNIDEIIARAKDVGVKKIITNGTTPYSNKIALDLAKKYDIVYCALGLYPPDAMRREIIESGLKEEDPNFSIDDEISFIQKKIKQNKKVLAIGEVGLDYVSPQTDKKEQKETFQKFIELSEKSKKPLIIHSRKAENDVVDMLECSTLKNPVMHCFSGKFKLVKRIQDNGWNFSIPTNIVRSQQFQKIVETTRLKQILTETDAPFLSPFKEKINEPSFITESINVISKIKRITPEEASNQIYMNFQRIFL